jgi:phage terminase large subunit-like protein
MSSLVVPDGSLWVPDRKPVELIRPSEAEALISELETRKAENNLHEFVRQSWHVIEPKNPFKDNWHIGAVCEHLTAVSMGQILVLLINMPPGTMKSFLFSVLWPTWEWIKNPHYRYLCASHDQTLSTRDSMRVRDIVESEWFQARWPHVQLRDDENQKTKFATTQTGWRIATSVKGRGVGEHPNRKIIDDAHKPTEILEAEDSAAVMNWYKNTMSQRGKGLGAATVLGGQRLADHDIFGSLQSEEEARGAVHLVLPMRYDPKLYIDLKIPETTKIGFKDPRTVEDELLWPEMFDEENVQQSETDLGEDGAAAQLQQRPIQAKGTMFNKLQIKIIERLPDDAWQAVRYWDTAATEGGKGAQTAGVRMVKTRSLKFIITDIEAGRWADPLDTIKRTAKLDGLSTVIREEQEPGGSGKRVVSSSKQEIRKIGPYDYDGVKKVENKPKAATPLARAVRNEIVYILVKPDDEIMREKAKQFLDQLGRFPKGKLKDMVDAAAGAYNFLALEDQFRPSLDDNAEYPLHY